MNIFESMQYGRRIFLQFGGRVILARSALRIRHVLCSAYDMGIAVRPEGLLVSKICIFGSGERSDSGEILIQRFIQVNEGDQIIKWLWKRGKLK